MNPPATQNSTIARIVLLAGWIGLMGTPDVSSQADPALSIFDAYERLDIRYPELQNGSLIEEIHALKQQRIDKDRLPDVYLRADGRLQSENAHLNLPPGTELPFTIDVPLYSAKTYTEAQYRILDGGIHDLRQEINEIQLQADMQELEVSRFALRQRVNRHFVDINLLRQQEKLFELSLKDIQERKKKLAAGIEEGVILSTDLIQLEVRELEVKAMQEDIQYRLEGLIQSLGQLLDLRLSGDLQLQFPFLGDPSRLPPIDRPEYKLFELRQKSILANALLIQAGKKPTLSAFAQAGLGYPNPVNFLDNTVSPFAIAGVQFTYKLTHWDKDEIDEQLLVLESQKLDHARETFDFNLETQEAFYQSEVDRLKRQMENDEAIADMQGTILRQLAIQLDEGIITSSDYILQLNTELRARQNKLIHQSELLKLQLDFWNERGAY